MRLLVLTLFVLLAPTPLVRIAHGGRVAAPDATQVVLRGASTLEAALLAAAHPAFTDALPPRPIAVVVDVTPNTVRASREISAALSVLAQRTVAGIQMARLGAAMSRPVKGGEVVAAAVRKLLAKQSESKSTIQSLVASLRRVRGARPVIIYLADWHFEDDAGLEKFIAGLARKGMTLSVVGSEAAFGRGWTDGICEDEDRRADHDRGVTVRDHFEGIGRSPFQIEGHDAPWHGGDTAYPHVPYRWWSYLWGSTFSDQDFRAMGDDDEEEDKEEREDLAARKKRRPLRKLTEAELSMEFPLPSSFGPYSLMRAAGVTGGRYVIWSWNPAERRTVRYDYSRCNLFPPDLRPRKDLLADLRRNPHARACQAAWHALLPAGQILVEHTPSVRAKLRRAAEQVYVPFAADHYINWDNAGMRRAFIRTAEDAVGALVKAEAILALALKDQAVPEAGPPRRHQADALLLHHIVLVAEFQLSEAVTAARAADYRELARGGKTPKIRSRVWIDSGRDPVDIRTRRIPPFDEKRAARVMAARRKMLERFRGTPFGEQVALNDIYTWRPSIYVENKGTETGRSPAESKGSGPTTGRGQGGSSGGGGATTGR